MPCTHAHQDIREKVRSYGQQKGFDPDFTEAVCVQEGGNTDGENVPLVEGVKYRWTRMDVGQYAHGPMQIRPAAIIDVLNSRGQGSSIAGFFKTDSRGNKYAPTLAADPTVMGVEFGIDYLALMHKKATSEGLVGDKLLEATAAKYNAGPNAPKDSSGKFRNQLYPDGVDGHLRGCTGKGFGDVTTRPAPIPSDEGDGKGHGSGGLGATGPGQEGPPGGGGGGGGGGPVIGGPIPAGGDGVCKQIVVPMDLFPVPPSPYFAYFSITIYGARRDPIDSTPDPNVEGPPKPLQDSIVLTPERPQYVSYFELSESFSTTECRIKVFDPNWDRSQQIAEAISLEPFEAKNNQVYKASFIHEAVISFGYVTDKYPMWVGGSDPNMPNLWSEKFRMLIESFHPEFLSYGVEMEFVFYGKSSYLNNENQTKTYRKIIADPLDVVKRSDGTEGPGNQTVIGDICQQKDWDMCVASTERVLQRGAALSSAAPEDRAFLCDNRGVVTFIKDEVVPMCALRGARDIQSGKLNQGDFRFRMEDDSPDGRPRLHLHHLGWAGKKVREYVYARQRYGAIISFKPDIWGGSMAAMGSVQAETRGYDPIEKQFYEHIYTLDAVKNSGNFSSSNLIDLSKLSKADLRKLYPSVTIDAGQTEIEALNYWQKAHDFVMSAELQIIGDPLIKPHVTVQVTVLNFFETDKGDFKTSISYLSGLWMVISTRHIIQAGEFLTVLDLQRNDSLASSDGDIDGSTTPEGNLDTTDEAFFNNFPNSITP